MLTVHKCCDPGLFRPLSNHAVLSILFHKYVSYESYLLFKNVQDLISSSEIQKKIQKILLVFKIIALNSFRWTLTFTVREYLSSAFNMLTNILKISDFWLSIGVLTRGISVATLFAEYNFENTSGMRLAFVLKMLKIWCRLHKYRKKLKNYFRFTV